MTERDNAALADRIASHAVIEAELQRAKQAAEAANAAKTRYLVAVSHEIRSPLNAIYGYAQLLERDNGVSAREAGGVIRRAAEHLTNLVEGLLEISRIESGVTRVSADVVQLPLLLDHVVNMFRMQADAKGITLSCESTGRVPRFVRTDEKRLRQILINLLSNAIKYTSKGSATLSIAFRSQVAEIDVIDTGIGIAPDELERVFEPFERGSAPEAQVQPGIGLGLAITRVLARVLGGEVVATSTPGVGSRFRLSLYLPEPFQAPTEAADYQHVTGYAGNARTVLIIDDDFAQITVVDRMLRELGFVVYAASSGGEGLALAERCRPELVLLDIQMPGMGGWEVAARLRETRGDGVRIVMVSANSADTQLTGARGPHDTYLPKPVELKALLETIGRELDLEWTVEAEEPGVDERIARPSVPPEAADALRHIRSLADAGDIRGIETALARLADAVPGATATVAHMREYVGNFDLRALMKALDGIAPR